MGLMKFLCGLVTVVMANSILQEVLPDGNPFAGFNYLQYVFNLMLATVGMIIFIGWGVREHLKNFDWTIFYNHNKVYVIWISLMQILIIGLVTFVPDTAQAIQSTIGLALTSEPSAYVSLGWGLSIAVHSANKKKLDKKPVK